MTILNFILVTLIVPICFASAKNQQSSKDVIENFYQQYLDFNVKTSKGSRPTLLLSKSFKKLIVQNRQACKRHAGTDVCGFGADGDIYLNTQETDPKLTFKNSDFSASQLKADQVEVTFNVYPSLKDTEGFYKRKILFQMIQEKGLWAVDDILYTAGSARKEIAEQIKNIKTSKK